MKYQVRYFLPFGFSFAHVESMRNCILISARRTRSLCPAMHSASSLPAYRRRHAGFSGACPRATTCDSRASGQYYVGVCPLPFRAIVESVFCSGLVTADPFDLRARAVFAFFDVTFGMASLISPRLASTGVMAESCCIVLDASKLA